MKKYKTRKFNGEEYILSCTEIRRAKADDKAFGLRNIDGYKARVTTDGFSYFVWRSRKRKNRK